MQSCKNQPCGKLIAMGMFVAIGLSSWKMLDTTLAVTRQLLLAVGTAALFCIVCIAAHVVMTEGGKSRRRMAICIIYFIKLVVASLFSLKLAAPSIVKHVAYSASQDGSLSNLLMFMLSVHPSSLIVEVLLNLLFVIMFDVLIIVLELFAVAPARRVTD